MFSLFGVTALLRVHFLTVFVWSLLSVWCARRPGDAVVFLYFLSTELSYLVCAVPFVEISCPTHYTSSLLVYISSWLTSGFSVLWRFFSFFFNILDVRRDSSISHSVRALRLLVQNLDARARTCCTKLGFISLLCSSQCRNTTALLNIDPVQLFFFVF